jgi:hypothetical protein
MNDDELAPHISDAIKHVAPATSALRDEHIAAALAEISPVSSRSRTTWLSAAAAIVVLLIGGNALYASLAPSENSPTEIAMTDQTSPLSATTKGTIQSPTNATDKGFSSGSACGTDLTGYTIVGTYTASGSVQEVWSSSQNLAIVDQVSCALLGTFTHPVIVASDNGCAGFALGAGNQGVGTYSVAGTDLTLVATPTELQIHGGYGCEVIASYPLPTQP